MTITAVGSQAGGATPVDSGTSIARAFGSNVTAGNLIVVVCVKYTPSTDAFVSGDCTKSAGTATVGTIRFTTPVQIETEGGFASVGIWYVDVTGTGSCTMTVAGAVAGSYLLLATSEWAASTGWTAASCLEDDATSSSGTNSATSATSTDLISAAGGLFIGGLSVNSGSTVTITPEAAFTEIYESQDGSAHQVGSMIYRISSGALTDAVEWAMSGTSEGWSAAGALFKETTPGGGGGSIVPLMMAHHE